MKTIIATLAVNVRVVADIVEQEKAKRDEPVACTVAGNADATVIKGPAAFVMCVIGALAAVGEDGLIAADAENDTAATA